MIGNRWIRIAGRQGLWAVLLGTTLALPPALSAQPPRRQVRAAWPAAGFAPVGAPIAGGRQTGLRMLASAVVPGSGQALASHGWTAAMFAVVEGVSWWIHLDARRERDDFRRAYRQLAWTTARGERTPRIDGPFEYYERMVHWSRSGAFDVDPDRPGLQPERDPAAYNGRQWRLAADIYLGGATGADPSTPGYDAALAYYETRAYSDTFLWDWSGLDDDRARFGALIDEGDRVSRRASVALGAIIANHILSPVEAFVRDRLAVAALEMRVGPGLPRSGPSADAAILIRIIPVP